MSTIATARRADSRWWLGLLVYLLIGCYAVDRTAGPRPRWREAEDRVSAARARETLAVLLGEEEKPHPAGTVHNEHVRVRLLGLLDELKVQTWVMPVTEAVIEPMIEPILKRTGETREQIVARLQLTSPMANIVGRVAGERRGRPVILATHYDSAFNAPGAGDAGQCVAAILETVRALRSEPLKYEVWLLLTDAEEFGLWGAQALMKEKSFPWGDEVPIVINFDARGDRGAVLLYETHEDNLRAMQVAARGIASPGISTSLMVNVYNAFPTVPTLRSFVARGGAVGTSPWWLGLIVITLRKTTWPISVRAACSILRLTRTGCCGAWTVCRSNNCRRSTNRNRQVSLMCSGGSWSCIRRIGITDTLACLRC